MAKRKKAAARPTADLADTEAKPNEPAQDEAAAQFAAALKMPPEPWPEFAAEAAAMIERNRQAEAACLRSPEVQLWLQLQQQLGTVQAYDHPREAIAEARAFNAVLALPPEAAAAIESATPDSVRKMIADSAPWAVNPDECKLTAGKTNSNGGHTGHPNRQKAGKKIRVLTDAAKACGRAYSRALVEDPNANRNEFCQNWTAENGDRYRQGRKKPPSWQTINKALQDHPAAWKPTADKIADTTV